MVIETRSNIDFDAIIKELDEWVVKVGYFNTAHYPDGTPVAYVAAIQNLGYAAGGIPPRATMQPAMMANKELYAKLVQRAFQNAINGAPITQGLEALGEFAAGNVKQAITELRSPELKAVTVAARARRHSRGIASDKPLVDSGQMLQATTYAVERSDE